MKLFREKLGKLVRLTAERQSHINKRQEMVRQIAKIEETLREPEVVRSFLHRQAQAGRDSMAKQQLSVWYDREGDYLEIAFADRKGYFQDAGDDVFIRVDQKGRIIGFAMLNFSKQTQRKIKLPITVELMGVGR